MRKTKIICTIGPACTDGDILTNMIDAGMDVARLNFSHGTHEEHRERLKLVRQVAKQTGKYLPCLLDTKGPEIRIGVFEKDKITLTEGHTFTLTTKEVTGNEKTVSVSFKDLPNDVNIGSKILIDDGLIELEVTDIKSKTDIICKVINGGVIGSRKGVNVPGISLSMPYISEKDEQDIIFAAKCDFDFVAASFTRNAKDILDIRKILDRNGGKDIKIIAKIENAEGVKNIESILRVCDGIMVARGDMGVEIPLEEVPVLQKNLITMGYSAGKIVITATQMLDSMMHNPRPTRAETNDVATAIYEGTSAIMLSGETAAGKYPVEAVKTMAKIALRTEGDVDYITQFRNNSFAEGLDVTNAISHAACVTAYDLDAKSIITVTKSGKSARLISKYRPAIPIYACSPDKKVLRQLSMSWGVIPVPMEEKTNTEELLRGSVANCKNEGLIKDGDLVVICAGIPLGVSGTTNLLKVEMVGDVLVKGKGANNLCASARLCVAVTKEQALQDFNTGDILVLRETSIELLDILKRASAIITEEKLEESNAVVVGLSLDIPVICEAENATLILRSGTIVKVDSGLGLVQNTDTTI